MDEIRSGGANRAPWRIALAVGLVAIAYGAWAAIRSSWLCDDAFISFRYAENLTRGLGLVFNAGERVEGYSNFLWTLGIALGMRLGVAPEVWSVAWGVVFYVATLALLLADFLRVREDAAQLRAPNALIPLACVLAAVHPDWQVFATSGLETSCFTFLVTAGYLLGVRSRWGLGGLAGSGLLFALAALTRPDGVLFVPLMVAYALWARRPRVASAAAFGGAFLAVWLPYLAWKLAYYGDWVPNTYYAKSAYLSWWDQGWLYVSLYFQRYWALAFAFPVAVAASIARVGPRGSRAEPQANEDPVREMLLALALGIAYILAVMRVGGDFMYARFLIPATPFYILALVRGVELLPVRRPGFGWIAPAGLVTCVSISLSPLRSGEFIRGITEEKDYYSYGRIESLRRQGLTLRRYFEGLPVRIAFTGTQAALTYYARPAIAIEATTGLTDRWIAHQPLVKRGRIGHEKLAPPSYLMERKVDLIVGRATRMKLLPTDLPVVRIDFDTVRGQIVHWNPALLEELARRGARFPDFLAQLDRDIAVIDRHPDPLVWNAYRRAKAFYFDYVSDPVRERPFLDRLERAPHAAR